MELPNSLAFRLVCLDSRVTQAVRTVHVDNSKVLHELQQIIQDGRYKSLRDVAAGTVTWAEYMAGDPITDDMTRDFLGEGE